MKHKTQLIILWLMPAIYLLASTILLFKGLSILNRSQNIILGAVFLFYSLFRFYRVIKSIRPDEKELDD